MHGPVFLVSRPEFLMGDTITQAADSIIYASELRIKD
ncbi:MAG: hypothetical protein ACJAWL_001563 [Motiliproteus sp.]|jgi:hypothetical protein